MKRPIFLITLLIFASVIAEAQKAIEKAKFLDNIYIGIQGGANTPLSFNQAFPLNTTAGIRIGEDISPVFGFNFEFAGWFNDHCGGHINGYAKHFSNNSTIHLVSAGLNGTINMSNLFSEYKGEPRTIEYSAILGIGEAFIFNRKLFTKEDGKTREVEGAESTDDDELIAKTGMDITWNIGKKKAWQAYIEPSVIWNLNGSDDGDCVKFNKQHAFLQLALGVNYKFMTSNGTHNFKLYDIQALNNKINNLNRQIENQKEELAAKPKEVIKEVTKEVTTTNVQNTQQIVFFAKNSSTLDNDAKAVLDNIANGSTVDITATSSPEGNKKHNEILSQDRADTVKKYLEDKGIVVNSAVGKGAKSNSSNRVAIINICK